MNELFEKYINLLVLIGVVYYLFIMYLIIKIVIYKYHEVRNAKKDKIRRNEVPRV